eukprot:scaffold20948_cov156-Isochrysis_galbana.AAC.1
MDNLLAGEHVRKSRVRLIAARNSSWPMYCRFPGAKKRRRKEAGTASLACKTLAGCSPLGGTKTTIPRPDGTPSSYIASV